MKRANLLALAMVLVMLFSGCRIKPAEPTAGTDGIVPPTTAPVETTLPTTAPAETTLPATAPSIPVESIPTPDNDGAGDTADTHPETDPSDSDGESNAAGSRRVGTRTGRTH